MRKQQLEHLHSQAMRARVTKALVFLRQEERELDQAPAAEDPGGCGPCRRLRAADLDARLRPDPGRHPPRRDARAGSPRPPRGRASPASPRSPGTAACARTAASSRAAAARSAAPSTWPPSPPCASRPARSSPATPSSPPRQSPQARPHRPHARHPRHPQRHAKGKQPWKHPREASAHNGCWAARRSGPGDSGRSTACRCSTCGGGRVSIRWPRPGQAAAMRRLPARRGWPGERQRRLARVGPLCEPCAGDRLPEEVEALPATRAGVSGRPVPSTGVSRGRICR